MCIYCTGAQEKPKTEKEKFLSEFIDKGTFPDPPIEFAVEWGKGSGKDHVPTGLGLKEVYLAYQNLIKAAPKEPDEPWAEKVIACPFCGTAHVPSYVCPLKAAEKADEEAKTYKSLIGEFVDKKPKTPKIKGKEICADCGWQMAHGWDCPNRPLHRRAYERRILIKNGVSIKEAALITENLSMEEIKTLSEWDKEYADADL